MKGKPSPQTTIGTGKGPSKSSKGDASTLTQDTPFFTVAPQKGKDAVLKGERKTRIRGRTRVALKARVKIRVRTKKVDRTRSPPFRLVLGRIFNLLLCFFASLTCSRPRSPPFRTVRGLSTILCFSLCSRHVTTV